MKRFNKCSETGTSITRIHNTCTQYTHKILWAVCLRQKAIADRKNETRPHFRLTTMLMAYFAFEGYVNFLGALLCPTEWKNEKSFFSCKPYHGIKGKMKFLANQLDIQSLCKLREFNTVMSLNELRSYVVHAKTVEYQEVLEHRGEGMPQSKPSHFERMVEHDRMARAVNDVQWLAALFHNRARTKSDDPVFDWPPFKGPSWQEIGDVETISE